MKNNRLITIYTNNIKEIVSHFNENLITEELSNYIMHQCLGLSVRGKLTLNFVGRLNSKEQEIIKKAIHNYYKFHIEHYKNIDKYDEWIRLALLLFGIIFIFASQKFDYVVNEFLLIIGWLAIWELSYDILFDKRTRTRNYLRYKQIYNCEIEFSNKEVNNEKDA